MNPYEQDPSSSNGDANQGNGYVNYYNPYVPSYVVDNNSSNPNTPVIIDSSASTATQYYSSYPNSDVNYNGTSGGGGGANYSNNYSNVVDNGSSGYYSNQQQPPVSEPSIVVINQRPTETVVQLPPQKIHDDKFDPVLQRELANSSNISAVSERTTTPATTTPVASTTSYSNYNNNYALNTSNTSNHRRRSWSCPTISCSCPSISWPSLDCYSFKKKFWLYALSVSAVVLALVLFGIGGALYGVVNSDYYCYNDPNGLSYIHQGCCNITISGCTYYKSTSNCRFTVSFPLLTSSALQQDPKKGFGLTCSAAGKTITTMNSYTTYSSSYALSLAKTQFVDCYTNKYETVVSLQPYSDLYSSYITGGIVCFSFGSSVLAFVLIKVGIWVYVKWKTS